MEDRLKSKDELLGLLGNCILALTLLPDECLEEIEFARNAAGQHTEELNQRFPDWRDELPKMR
jgi:hypothetical protein